MHRLNTTQTRASSHVKRRDDNSLAQLNEVDKEVLRLISEGISNKAIACRLGTTVAMIKYRTNRIFVLLGVRNRVQAAIRVEGCLGCSLNGGSLCAAGPMPERLSTIELSILTFVSHGCTTQQLAGLLGMRLATVKWHLTTVFGKLQVENRLQAITRARQMRLL